MNTNLIDHVQQVHHKNMTPSSLQSNMDISIERLLYGSQWNLVKMFYGNPLQSVFLIRVNSCNSVRHEALPGKLVRIQPIQLSVQMEAKKMAAAARRRSKLFIAASKP